MPKAVCLQGKCSVKWKAVFGKAHTDLSLKTWLPGTVGQPPVRQLCHLPGGRPRPSLDVGGSRGEVAGFCEFCALALPLGLGMGAGHGFPGSLLPCWTDLEFGIPLL